MPEHSRLGHREYSRLGKIFLARANLINPAQPGLAKQICANARAIWLAQEVLPVDKSLFGQFVSQIRSFGARMSRFSPVFEIIWLLLPPRIGFNY